MVEEKDMSQGRTGDMRQQNHGTKTEMFARKGKRTMYSSGVAEESEEWSATPSSPDGMMHLHNLGDAYAASQMESLDLPFFDIGIVAGFPIPLDNDERAQSIDLLRLLCPNPLSCYLIRVQGDSMIDSGIFSGDIVVVDKSNRHPTEEQVAVCELNGEYTLKHFVMRDGCGWLVPANPVYPEIKVREEDDFSVWGTVTYVIHKPGV